jgi:hypothetical protein
MKYERIFIEGNNLANASDQHSLQYYPIYQLFLPSICLTR